MSISLTKRIFITRYTLVMVTAAWIIGPAMAIGIPEHYFEWYPFIPVFFYVFGWFNISMFEACQKYNPQKTQLYYLVTKAIKMLLSLMILLLYAVKIEEKKTEFSLVFLLFYLISLIFESCFFLRYEKRQKTKNNEQ